MVSFNNGPIAPDFFRTWCALSYYMGLVDNPIINGISLSARLKLGSGREKV